MNKFQSIALRYVMILTLGINNFYIISKIITPLTIHITRTTLNIFTPTTLTQNIIQTQTTTIQLIPACIAISAYYLLIFLLLATPNIQIKTRIYTILTATLSLLILNTTRILILIPLTQTQSFATIHWATWHIFSTTLVAAIYITTIKLYKIKSTPIYSDLKYLKSQIKKPKRKIKHKK